MDPYVNTKSPITDHWSLTIDDYVCSKLRSIHAAFSCVCRRWVTRSTVG